MLFSTPSQPYVPSSLDRFAAHLQLSTFFMAGAFAYLYRDRDPRSYGWLEVAGLALLATAILEVGFVELLPLTGTYVLLYSRTSHGCESGRSAPAPTCRTGCTCTPGRSSSWSSRRSARGSTPWISR